MKPGWPPINGVSRQTISRFWVTYSTSWTFRILSVVVAVPILVILGAMIYVTYNRAGLPDLESFIHFEPPTAGHIYDANGQVLIELGAQRREILEYKNIPDVLRNAILSAEDENYFSHSGVDFSVYPRLLSKMNVRALFAQGRDARVVRGGGPGQVFPQGDPRSPSSSSGVSFSSRR